MTSLTQVAVTTRRIIRYSVYLLIILILGRAVFGIGYALFRAVFPKPPPAPTIAFGKLPGLTFPERKGLPALSYTVETVEGGLSTLPPQAKVYFMPKPARTQLNLQDTKSKAASMGFTVEPEPVSESETLYRFRHPRALSTLEINIITNAFSLSYDFAGDPSVLDARPPSPEIASSQVRSFLSSADLLPKDLTGPTTHEFLKVEARNLVTALSLSEANLIKINLFRKSFDEIPSLTPDPSQANVWFLVSGATQRDRQITAGQYHYFPLDETQSSTYPVKTSESAFEELKSGNGFIANLGLNQDGKIIIRRVYLAYYDSGTQDKFYQPIIVFEGDRGFIAYVPAVTAEYYGE